jgi:endo-1,4-beta-D-glucanase Y
MEYEQKPISDEIEQFEEQPFRIKTMFVKSEDEEDVAARKKKLMGAAKVAAGVGIVAAAGLAAFLLGSRKKR